MVHYGDELAPNQYLKVNGRKVMAPVHSYDIDEGWVDIFMPVIKGKIELVAGGTADEMPGSGDINDPTIGFEEEVKRLTGPVEIVTLTAP